MLPETKVTLWKYRAMTAAGVVGALVGVTHELYEKSALCFETVVQPLALGVLAAGVVGFFISLGERENVR